MADNTGLVIVLVVLIVLLLGGGGLALFFLLKASKSTEPQPSPPSPSPPTPPTPTPPSPPGPNPIPPPGPTPDPNTPDRILKLCDQDDPDWRTRKIPACEVVQFFPEHTNTQGTLYHCPRGVCEEGTFAYPDPRFNFWTCWPEGGDDEACDPHGDKDKNWNQDS